MLIILISYLVSKIHNPYLLFNNRIIYRRTLMRYGDGGSQAHSLHYSIHFIVTTLIQYYFQKMI